MMQRVRRNGDVRFVARCGHLVPANYDYVETTTASGPTFEAPTLARWCSPACADRAEGETTEEPERCCWRGCKEEGTRRDIHLSLPAPRIGGGASVLVTFSDDVPLCDEHDTATRRMIEDLIHEEMGGADG